MRLHPNMIINVRRLPTRVRGAESAAIRRMYQSGEAVRDFLPRVGMAGLRTEYARWMLTWDHRKGYIELTLDGVSIARTARVTPDYVAPELTFADTFGVELETLMPSSHSREGVASGLGVPARATSYSDNYVGDSQWKVKPDGSVSQTMAAELVSPILRGREGLEQIAKVCAAAHQMRLKITKKCGLHVHVGVADRDVGFFKRLHAFYAANEHLFDSVMPDSRRNNRYCESVKHYNHRVQMATTVREAYLASGGKYRKLNLESFARHGTVEFRHHSGTVEAEKVCNWVKLCLRVVALAGRPEPVPSAEDLSELLTVLGCDNSERDYWQARAARFAANERLVA